MTASSSERTILVVEDQPEVLSLLADALQMVGYRVLTAAHADDGLAIGDEHAEQIDLVLTDVVMPDLGGPELVGRLLDRWPGMRAVYMSGYAEGDKIRVGMEDSQTSFLQKPFSADNLVLTVREVLDQGSSRPPGPPSGCG